MRLVRWRANRAALHLWRAGAPAPDIAEPRGPPAPAAMAAAPLWTLSLALLRLTMLLLQPLPRAQARPLARALLPSLLPLQLLQRPPW